MAQYRVVCRQPVWLSQYPSWKFCRFQSGHMKRCRRCYHQGMTWPVGILRHKHLARTTAFQTQSRSWIGAWQSCLIIAAPIQVAISCPVALAATQDGQMNPCSHHRLWNPQVKSAWHGQRRGCFLSAGGTGQEFSFQILGRSCFSDQSQRLPRLSVVLFQQVSLP